MNDTYRSPITKDEMILLLVKELVGHNIDVCKLIIQNKRSLEAKETVDYYHDRWENIAGSYYRVRDTDQDKYSLIWDYSKYIIKKDHNPIFYNLTGISYQVVDLIRQLIKLHKIDADNTHIEDYQLWLARDDKLYSILADKIMRAMKPN
jgi:hypothetical protein